MITKTRIAAIIIRNNKLLMLKGRGYDELWTPGGKIEPGETHEECLKRELKEEIGVSLKSMAFYKEYLAKSFYHKHMTRMFAYIVKIEGDPVPAAEIDSVIWLTKKDFEQKKYPMLPVHENKMFPDLIKDKVLK